MTLEEKRNEMFNVGIYLQLVGAFDPTTNFMHVKEIVSSTYNFVKNTSNTEFEKLYSMIDKPLQQMAAFFIKKYPPKKDINTIATKWNEYYKQNTDIYEYGIYYGWLEELMDLKKLKIYDYLPYHFNLGLAANKNYGAIEEEFLLKDAFDVLVKAEYYFEILKKYGSLLKDKEDSIGNCQFTEESYKQITDIKYEVALYSRLTIISFYSFIECFTNSIGFDYLQRHRQSLTESEKELLIGMKKGRFLQLKSKIEKYQQIIRNDKKCIIVISDDTQIKEPFISFFGLYEELRNSSVHYSPLKEKIWLKPGDWIKKAREFSKFSMDVGLAIWKACHENNDAPQYIGKLNYELHINLAKDRLSQMKKIENELDIYDNTLFSECSKNHNTFP